MSSKMHEYCRKLDPEDLNFEKSSYSIFESYNRSKLCNILFNLELAERLHGTGSVWVCCGKTLLMKKLKFCAVFGGSDYFIILCLLLFLFCNWQELQQTACTLELWTLKLPTRWEALLVMHKHFCSS